MNTAEPQGAPAPPSGVPSGRSPQITGPISTEQIQRNQHLIAAILEHQNAHKLADCLRLQHILQQNLSFLSVIADFHPSTLQQESQRAQADASRPAGTTVAPAPLSAMVGPPPVQRAPTLQPVPSPYPLPQQMHVPGTVTGPGSVPMAAAPPPPMQVHYPTNSVYPVPPHLMHAPPLASRPMAPMSMTVTNGPARPAPQSRAYLQREEHERFFNLVASAPTPDFTLIGQQMGWTPTQARHYYQTTLLKCAWRMQRTPKDLSVNDMRREVPDLPQPSQQTLRQFLEQIDREKRAQNRTAPMSMPMQSMIDPQHQPPQVHTANVFAGAGGGVAPMQYAQHNSAAVGVNPAALVSLGATGSGQQQYAPSMQPLPLPVQMQQGAGIPVQPPPPMPLSLYPEALPVPPPAATTEGDVNSFLNL